MNFDSFAFHSRIAANIARLGYQTPTPIQEQAIPPVMAGKDVMGLAQTGTGKTAAFMLPIIERFLKNPARKRGQIRSLVIAPTRELAEQLSDSALELSAGTMFKTITVYGGVALNPQTVKLRAGADLVVACPGRLLDHVNQGHVDLSQVEVLVLDEADHMFDMGFLPDIKRILAKLPTKRQTLLFSATMPESIRGLANEILVDPVTVKIGHAAPAQTVAQAIYPVEPRLKTSLLLALLGQAEGSSVLVFTRTKHRAKRLAEQIGKAGHRAAALQGNLSQRQRQAALDGFRDGRFNVLVATDIAARGIDVTRVGHVINFDIPDTPETYTHRVGRTGRAERTGMAHSLVTREDVGIVRAIERLLGKPLPRRNLEGFDYHQAPPAEHDLPRAFTPADRNDRRPRTGGASAQQREYRARPQAAAPSGERQPAARPRPQSGERQPAARPRTPSGDRRSAAESRSDRDARRPRVHPGNDDRRARPQAAREYGDRQPGNRVAPEYGDRARRPQAAREYGDRQPWSYGAAHSDAPQGGRARAPKGASEGFKASHQRKTGGAPRKSTPQGEPNGNVMKADSGVNPYDFVQPTGLYPGGVDAPTPKQRASYAPQQAQHVVEAYDALPSAKTYAANPFQPEESRPGRASGSKRGERSGRASAAGHGDEQGRPARRRIFLNTAQNEGGQAAPRRREGNV